MKEQKNFIKTTDKHTADVLKEIGLQIIDESNGIWTFINYPGIIFNNHEIHNITYSNLLTV